VSVEKLSAAEGSVVMVSRSHETKLKMKKSPSRATVTLFIMQRCDKELDST